MRVHDIGWWVVAVNQLGSVLFFLAGLAAFTRPATSSAVDIGLVNWGTFAGAVCFAIGGRHPGLRHDPLRQERWSSTTP